jgi:hypothetical protein
LNCEVTSADKLPVYILGLLARDKYQLGTLRDNDLSVRVRRRPAILNTENLFNLKTIERSHMPIEGLYGFKNKDIEKVSYRSPEFYLRA